MNFLINPGLKLYLIGVLAAPLFQFESVQCYQSSQMDPNRKQFIKEMITSMNIRQLGEVLNDASLEAYMESVNDYYFEDPDEEESLYRKFVLAFEAHVKPKLTLNHGDSCDPSYTSQYKYPENHLIRDESLQHWVGLHVPTKATGQAQISFTAKYCDFRRGLVCSSSSRKCECPDGANYMDADDPTRYLDKYCFIQPNNKCQLLDIDNDSKTRGMLLDQIPYLIFNPERPASCSPGTQCRFKPPFMRVPRCWCMVQSTNPSCADAKLYWPLPSSPPSTLPPDSLSLPELFQSILKATSDFEVHSAMHRTPDESPISHGITAPPELIEQYNKLRSIDEIGATVDIAALQAMKTALTTSASTHCWIDLILDYGCEARRASTLTQYLGIKRYTTKNYCSCQLKPDSDYTEEHQNIYTRYGSPCQIGTSGCRPAYTCQRWDKTSSEGICYCSDGYGWASYCGSLSAFEYSKTSLANFIHPTIVAVRGDDLSDIQDAIANYDSEITWGGDPGSGDGCPLHKEQERAEAYRFFTSLQERTVTDAAGSSGLDRAALEIKVKTLEEAYNADDNFCDRKHGFVCVANPKSTNQTEGVCREAMTPVPDADLIEKNPVIKKWNEKVAELAAYKERAAQYLLDNVDLVKEVECVVAPAPYAKSAVSDVDENGECLGANICMEDYSNPLAFLAKFDVTWADGSKATVAQNNGDEPTLNQGDVAVLTECQAGSVPAKTMCQCLHDGWVDYYEYEDEDDDDNPSGRSGSPRGRSVVVNGFVPCDAVRSSYKNCEKFMLEEKVEVVKNLIMTKSTLTGGQRCDHKAEYYVKAGINSRDLYQILGNLKMALKQQKPFCDRRKLLVCGSQGTCACRGETDYRRTKDGQQLGSVLVRGSCKQDVTSLAHMFPTEKQEAVAHYGDPMDTGSLDANGCMKNLCVQMDTSTSTCIPDEKFVVIQPAPPPPPPVLGPGSPGGTGGHGSGSLGGTGGHGSGSLGGTGGHGPGSSEGAGGHGPGSPEEDHSGSARLMGQSGKMLFFGVALLLGTK